MASTVEFSTAPQAPWTNVPPGNRSDQVASAPQIIGGRYETLCRLSESLVSGTLEDLLWHLRADLEAVLPFGRLDVVVNMKAEKEVRWASSTPKETTGDGVATREALLEYQRQLLLRIADCNTKEGCAVAGEEYRNLESKYGSFYGFPLRTPHRRVGALGLRGHKLKSLSTEDIEFLNQIAGQLAFVIDNWLTQIELQREKAQVKLLLDLTGQVLSNLELRDVVRAAMMKTRSVMQSDGACVFLQDPDDGELRVYAFDVPPGTEILQERTPIAFEGTIAGRVFQTGKLWAGSLEEAHALFTNPPPAPLTASFKTGCMLPISGRHRVLGTLGVGRHVESSYSQDEVDFLMQVSKQIAIAVENAFAYQEIKELNEKLAAEKVYLQDESCSEINFDEIVGKGAAIRRVLKQVETVAPTYSTVLICGETGTGKELIARAIHNLSPRHGNAFVKLNCAAIPTGLLESELFGHEKGAFTGAVAQRIGRFELANKGTVFLDEVGEIPLELQTKLLRILQEREFERLGSTRTIRTDARLIAATNRDLAEMVEQQKFRSDLFYRLNVFPVRVPALRERSEDIPLLVRHFVQHFARRMNRVIDTIPSETMSALIRYPWPGNIRELQNLMERAVILSPGPLLRVPLGDLPSRAIAGSDKARPQTLEEAERAHILATLKEMRWVVSGPKGAAARLGMNRSTLQFRMKKLGIVRPWKRVSTSAVTTSTRTPPS